MTGSFSLAFAHSTPDRRREQTCLQTPSLRPYLSTMPLQWSEVYQISLGENRLTVRVGSEDGRVQEMTCDLRHYVSGKAQSRGVTFSMAELEMLVKMTAIVQGSGRFFLPSSERSLRIFPNGKFTVFLCERPQVRRHINLLSSHLPSFLKAVPAAIFIMKNYGRRSSELAATAAYCLLLLEDKANFNRSMSRVCRALGVPREQQISHAKASDIGMPSSRGVELFTLQVFSSIADNEIVSY